MNPVQLNSLTAEALQVEREKALESKVEKKANEIIETINNSTKPGNKRFTFVTKLPPTNPIVVLIQNSLEEKGYSVKIKPAVNKPGVVLTISRKTEPQSLISKILRFSKL